MDIPRGTELLVWYNDSYTSFFGIPLQCIAQDENCKTLLSFIDVPHVNVTVTSECSIWKAGLALISTSLDCVNLCPFSFSLGLLCAFCLCFPLFLRLVLLSLSLIYFCLHHLQFSALSLFKFFSILSGFPCL